MLIFRMFSGLFKNRGYPCRVKLRSLKRSRGVCHTLRAGGRVCLHSSFKNSSSLSLTPSGIVSDSLIICVSACTLTAALVFLSWICFTSSSYANFCSSLLLNLFMLIYPFFLPFRLLQKSIRSYRRLREWKSDNEEIILPYRFVLRLALPLRHLKHAKEAPLYTKGSYRLPSRHLIVILRSPGCAI